MTEAVEEAAARWLSGVGERPLLRTSFLERRIASITCRSSRSWSLSCVAGGVGGGVRDRRVVRGGVRDRHVVPGGVCERVRRGRRSSRSCEDIGERLHCPNAVDPNFFVDTIPPLFRF